MDIFDLLHAMIGYYYAQINQISQLAPVASGKPDGRGARGSRHLSAIEHIARGATTADSDNDVPA